MIEVGPLTAAEFYRYSGLEPHSPPVGFAGRVGARTVAIGGILTGADGRVWGFIDCRDVVSPIKVAKLALRFMAVLRGCAAEPVHVWRDDRLCTSAAFLARLGFAPTGETNGDLEVWRWQI